MIAKYRKAEFPGEWWLTDFTMDQVERKIINLEKRIEQLQIENTQLKDKQLLPMLLTLLETAKTACDSGEFHGSTFECDESHILNLIQTINLAENIIK